jgi:hypothetical protein
MEHKNRMKKIRGTAKMVLAKSTGIKNLLATK